jgi:hypothetical protein
MFDGVGTPNTRSDRHQPYRNLLGIVLMLLADAIRAEQDTLKTSQAKLPAWGLPLLSLGPEQLALITLGTLFNMIARSEFDTCLPPPITPVSFEIGQRCRIERLDLLVRQCSCCTRVDAFVRYSARN